jgi:hypothetical protein
MHFPALIVTLVSIGTGITFGNPIEPQGLALRGTNLGLNVTSVDAAARKVSGCLKLIMICSVNHFLQLYPPLCNVNGWPSAPVSEIKSGINYLNILTSKGVSCDVGPGPRVCSRISCAYDSAIWLCNDVCFL